MRSLPELQRAFGLALLEGGAAEAPFLSQLEEPVSVARRRLAVYRRNVFGAMTGTLRATYPVVERIVGDAFFRHAAETYLRAHPSISGDLNDFGGAFADFLAVFAPAGGLPYLSDVALLEWQVQRLYYAGDHPPGDLSGLAGLPPERWHVAIFNMHSSWVVMQSPWPLADIWRVNQPDYADDMEVGGGPCTILAWRQAGVVRVAELTPGEASFIEALAAHSPLGIAAKSAAADPAFDLAVALARLAERELIVSVTD